MPRAVLNEVQDVADRAVHVKVAVGQTDQTQSDHGHARNPRLFVAEIIDRCGQASYGQNKVQGQGMAQLMQHLKLRSWQIEDAQEW